MRLLLPTTVVLAALLSACAGGAGDAEAPRHLILVSIDTLRADRLSSYGYDRPTSPALDRLAAQGVLFEEVVAESSWTLPAHVTLLSGLRPESHGVVLPELRVGPGTALLAEVLGDAGFRSFGGTEGAFVGRRYGFARGFERFDDAQGSLRETLRDARGFLSRLGEDERGFVFVHTYAVHCPYDEGDKSDARFRSPDAEFVETDGRCGNPHFNAMELRPGEVRHVSDCYDAGIRAMDDVLGEFLAWLDTEGLAAESLVAVTSDHGEELGEHGRIGHEGTLFREVLFVPWILTGPGLAAQRVGLPVGLGDVMPTLLELLGEPVPPGLDGRSLAGILGNGRTHTGGPRRSSLRWNRRLDSLLTDEHHLLVDEETGAMELYLRTDVREQEDLAERLPELARDLRGLLDAQPRPVPRPGAAEPVGAVTADELERLRALGYVE